MSGELSSEGEGTSQQNASQDSDILPRKRRVYQKKKNFLEQEIAVLVAEVVPRFEELFGSRKRSVPLSSRNKMWQDIRIAVNANGVDNRTVPELKKKWNDMRSMVKAKMSLIAKHNKGTGGGPPIPISLSSVEEQVSNTYQRVQIEGIGHLDTFALARQTDSENVPIENVAQDLEPEDSEETPEENISTFQPSTPSGQASMSQSNLGLNEIQCDFMLNYTQESISNFKAVGEKLSQVVERLENLNSSVAIGLDKLTNITGEIAHSIGQLANSLSSGAWQNLPGTISYGNRGSGEGNIIGNCPTISPQQRSFSAPSEGNVQWLHLSPSEGESSGEGLTVSRPSQSSNLGCSETGESSGQSLYFPQVSVPGNPLTSTLSNAANFLMDVKDQMSNTTCAIPLKKRSRKK